LAAKPSPCRFAIGSTTSGRHAVHSIRTASLIHQIAIQSVSPAASAGRAPYSAQWASGVSPPSSAAKATGPARNATHFRPVRGTAAV
jgi:hypothetical protein